MARSLDEVTLGSLARTLCKMAKVPVSLRSPLPNICQDFRLADGVFLGDVVLALDILGFEPTNGQSNEALARAILDTLDLAWPDIVWPPMSSSWDAVPRNDTSTPRIRVRWLLGAAIERLKEEQANV